MIYFQTSPESPAIFLLLQKMFRSQSVSDLQKISLEKGLTEEEFDVSKVSSFNSTAGYQTIYIPCTAYLFFKCDNNQNFWNYGSMPVKM